MKRSVVAVAIAGVLLAGYAAFDIADAAPGVLTLRPVPPPPPTETPGTRTLPFVQQPSPSTSVGMPLGSLAGTTGAPSATGIEKALRYVATVPALSNAAFVVRDGQSGEVLFNRGGSEPRIPASTTKILSAAAIGQSFSPDATLRTEVVQGVAANEIVLVAGGDSLISPGAGDPQAVPGHAGLADLADQVAKALKAKAVRSVTLAVDESYAYGPRAAPTWGPDYVASGISGAVAMLGLSTERASEQHPGSADPVASTRAALARLLTERGFRVAMGNRITKAAASTSSSAPVVLGSIESAPVRDQLALALTESDNALTEILTRQAAVRSGARADFASVGAWVVSRVAELGVDTRGATLSDASGLSRQNRVTAKLLTDVLVLGYDGTHPVLRTALDGLPIGGLTGTLADRFGAGPDHQAAGRARAKTGTLTGANALAGSVVDDSGRLLVFAGLVANAETGASRAALDRFVATLAACGCR